MKSLKAAAVVAGSLVAAGAAAPAFAHDPGELTPTSLNGGVNTLTSQRTIDFKDLSPLQHQSDTLDTENEDSVLSTVNGATDALNANGGPLRMLGGLPLRG
ncbi:hypothetical protein ACFV6E_12725 [Streptomyces sp. NPDC059785]|uniref:hypothetical protein n=1 Tax=unclassified Streptomyces TaxID=2593676 RepID=UPI003648E20E